MGYFALKANTFENEDLNNLEHALCNFKLCTPTHIIEYEYLINMSLSALDKINYYDYTNKPNNKIPNENYYNIEIYNVIISLFEDMLSNKTIYTNYILYIKTVLTEIKMKNYELNILITLLSKYVYIGNNNSCFENIINDYTNEYKFKSNLHFEELSEYFFYNIHPSNEVNIRYYDNERILYTVDKRHITDRNEEYYIKKLNEYKISTSVLDIVTCDKSKLKSMDILNSVDETLESLFQVVRKKDSKVFIKCVLNKIYYVIEEIEHFVVEFVASSSH